MYDADIRNHSVSLKQKLKQLFALRTGSRVNFDNKAYQSFLNDLGNPHLQLPPVIHVAGTNGKGSIVATLRAILESENYRVHAYTSPHLRYVNERIVLAGEEISDFLLESVIDEIMPLALDRNLSFFEIITALAFLCFSRIPADVLLLEVGMGGKLDCTNVIVEPIATVISRISKDHVEFLGDTLQKIAAEKAGIIKTSCPCVVSFQGNIFGLSVIYPILIREAKKQNAPILCCGMDWGVYSVGESMVLQYKGKILNLPIPNLAGAHQIYNAGAAVVALLEVSSRLPVSHDAIRKGLRKIEWPGRMQKLTLPKNMLLDNAEIWLDSGHNDSGGEIILAQLQEWERTDPKSFVLILGMLAHKDVSAFLAPFSNQIKHIILVGIHEEAAVLDEKILSQRAGNLLSHAIIESCEYIDQALIRIHEIATQPCRVLIAGSVYLAGDVLAYIQSKFHTEN